MIPAAANDRRETAAHVPGVNRRAAERASGMSGTLAAVAKVAAFFALLAVLIVVADRLIDRGLKRIDTGAFGVFNKIVDGRINADVVVTGSSRALTHFDPAAITRATGLSAFNIGINGSQTDMQVAVLKTYLRHNSAPRIVVHNLDSFTFVTSHGGVYFPGQYLPYLDQPDLYDALRTVDGEIWKSRWLPLYGYAVEDMNFTWVRGVARLFGRNPAEDRPLGFQPRYSAWTGEFERLRETHPDGVRFEVEPAGVDDLEDLLATCKAQGIKVVLAYSPVYYEMRALDRNRDDIFKVVRELARRHGAEVWDFGESPVARGKENFYNSQHLNAAGAEAFSAEFAAKLAAWMRETGASRP